VTAGAAGRRARWPVAAGEPAAVRLRRRRVIAAATSLGGAGLLGISLSTEADSPRFYALTLGLAGTWVAGALAVGPLEPGRTQNLRDAVRRQVAGPVLTGAGTFGLFYGAARLARYIPPLNRAIGSALHYADHGSSRLVPLTAGANAVAEELFFRGALWSLVEESSPIVKTTLAYSATIVATRNPALLLAGTATSVIFGLQRRASGGFLAPALAHLTWSQLMLRYLPRPP
jgi:membrane protease YdiL (CAAX protease family)